jgi:mitochondrial pyruvate carrier 2
MMKWCLVLAGVKDMGRPADKLSVSQNFGELFRRSVGMGHVERSLLAALAATGIIWVRYSFVITPVNYSLAAVRLHGFEVGIVCQTHWCV